MAGLTDLWNGNQGDDYPGIRGVQNSLVGLGLGLMAPGTLANALGGYEAGAKVDAANTRTRQSAREAELNRQMHREQMAQSASQFNKTFGLHERQFNEGLKPKPQIIQSLVENPDTGEKEPVFHMVIPGENGTTRVQRLSPEAAGNLGPALGGQQSAAPPLVQPPAMAQEGAVPFADPTQRYGLGPDVNSQQAQAPAPWQVAGRPAPNMRKYNEKLSTELGDLEGRTTEKAQHGQRVQTLIGQLKDQVRDPLFAQGAGPYAGAASQQSQFLPGGIPNPARLAYEYGPDSKMGSTEAKNHLGVVRQTAQTINSELQAAYLKGQGSVTENERMQIDKILGDIATARNSNGALANLANLQRIIDTTMARPRGWQPPPGEKLWTPPPQGQQVAPQGGGSFQGRTKSIGGKTYLEVAPGQWEEGS